MKRPAFVGDFDIPKVVQLPGCRVRVKVVPPEEANDVFNSCDGLWLYSHEQQRATILIDGRLPIEVQRYIVLHEVLHAVHEVIDVMLEYESDHVQTKSMAALRAALAAAAKEA